MIKNFLLKSIILLSIILISLHWLSSILVRPGHAAKLYQGWYDKSHQYDVLLLGSSHMNGMIDPQVLFNNYGITSFNYGTGGQPIDVTYYLLKEALKTHPETKIVVLDIYYLGLTNEYGEEGYIRNVLDNMRLSENKIDAIMDCTPREQRLYYLFPILKYKNRWASLTQSDFNVNLFANQEAAGFEAGDNKYGKDIASEQYSNEIGEIPDKTLEYLYKFMELSKERGFQLVLINAPYDYSSNDDNFWYKNDASMYNKVSVIAKNNNIPFINYSDKNKMKQIKFNFKEDMNNPGHTNIYGANKVSIDLANFLNNHYKLVDHRTK
ncbi:hypothetical protein ACN077_12990 [Clostridium chromiireducens]|uniref:hypothetical protein n=1 Tax=Clostridium chromiireducens TaxID=225345 RepID=UPI003AF4B103